MKDSIDLVKLVSVVAMTSVSIISIVGMVGLIIIQFAYSDNGLILDTQIAPKAIDVELTIDPVQEHRREPESLPSTETAP